MGISIGLVGLGKFGRNFADLFKKHPLVDRVALCDRESDRVARFASRDDWRDKFNPRDSYSSLDDICKSDLDALVIITQPWLHAPQCIQAMDSGKHVYSAVPVMCVPDSDEILDWCDRIVQTTCQTGMHYMLGETTYYHSDAMYCRRQAAAGRFGSFVYTEGEYYHPFDWPGCDLRDVQAWRTSSSIGRQWATAAGAYRARGAMDGPMHYPTHSTSGPMCVTSARPVKVSAFGQRPISSDAFFSGSAFSNETALFQMSDGSTMRICEHREGSLCRETFRVYGTLASYENACWMTPSSKTALTIEQMRDPLPTEVADAWRDPATGQVDYGGHQGSHAYLVNEFVDSISNCRRPAIHAWMAARFMAAGAAAHKSALRNGELLAVPDWGDAPAN